MSMLVADGFENLVASIGTDKDKARAAAWRLNLRTPEALETIYRSGWLGRKIIDVPTDDMVRRWRGWNADDAFVGAIEAAERRFKVRHHIASAKRWGRLYGSSAIIVGASQRMGSPDQPLLVERMQRGDLAYLHVDIYPRLQIAEWDADIASPEFGRPRMYLYTPVVRGGTGAQVRVHASRVIPFCGMPLPPIGALHTAEWGDSIFTALEETLNTAGSATAVIASLLYETKVDVIKTDLSGITTAAGEERIRKRFMLANVLKSINNTLLLGEGEEYEQKTFNFAGLPDIHIRLMQEVSGAADIPVTRLLGQSPAGLQATGESDLRNYYDGISAKQEDDLRGPLERLDAILIGSEGIKRDPDASFYFHSLWQESATQKAENAYKRAQAAKLTVDTGLIPEEVMQKALVSQLVEDSTYPALDAAMREYLGEIDGSPEPVTAEGNVVPIRRVAQDATPRTLYVSRKLKNGADLIAWARSQGFAETVPASELHVTVAYSRQPLDWMRAGPAWQGEELKIDAGGPRVMERFGEAVVLLFASRDLGWRHQEFLEAGASWDHPEYQPHVTIAWGASDVDLSKVHAYNGPLVFGPEIFAEVDEDWRTKVTA